VTPSRFRVADRKHRAARSLAPRDRLHEDRIARPPAANGRILYGTTAGDIESIDPASGVTATLLLDTDGVVVPSPDGSRLLFERTTGGTTTRFVADA
jgi:hypothetical protein